MKGKLALLLLGLLALTEGDLRAAPLGTAISYQGRLDDSGSPANGTYSFRYRLLGDAAGTTQIGPVVDLPSQTIAGGLLNAVLDFGSTAFTGDARWLEISVKPGSPSDAGEYLKLNPQPLPPAPSSQFARVAGDVLNGVITGNKLAPLAITTTHISDGSITAPKLASGQIVKSLNGLLDNVMLAAGVNVVLSTNGNTLTLSASGAGGGSGWSLAGNATSPEQFIGTLGSTPFEVRVNNARALLLKPDAISPNLIGGWSGNTVDGGVSGATIAGGGVETVLGRPGINRVTDHFGTVSGGANNTAGVAGEDFQDGWFATVGGGQSNRAEGVASTIGGGSENRTSGNDTTVAGGWRNQAISARATVSGGQANVAAGAYAAIAGGENNRVAADHSAIGGGHLNTIGSNSIRCVISGGYSNQIGELCGRSTIAGGDNHEIHDRSQGGTIGGGIGSRISDLAQFGTIAGGDENRVRGSGGTVGGGFFNTSFDQGVVGGGYRNTASGYASVVGGGRENVAGPLANYGAVVGGYINYAIGEYAFVGGGYYNVASGAKSTSPGGFYNEARGDYSFAAGRRAKALDEGSFVWADATDGDFGYGGANKFQVRASGGVLFYANPGGNVGVYLAPGGNSWAPTSDRNAKENFREINPREVLAKVVALPILNYNLKSQTNTIRHLGPMAQDFHAAFDLGEDDKHITTIDADGVTFAAIQGLNQKVEDEARSLREALQARDSETKSLKETVARLEELVSALANSNPRPD